jgi:uncharacterized protein (TIGR02246 family)
MSARPLSHSDTRTADEQTTRTRYRHMLDAWKAHSADGFAAPCAADAEVIGFDGSQMHRREEIMAALRQTCADHVTAAYVSKVRSVHLLSPDVAILRAIVGMVPPGQSDLNPAVNAHQTLIATRHEGEWQIALFQKHARAVPWPAGAGSADDGRATTDAQVVELRPRGFATAVWRTMWHRMD